MKLISIVTPCFNEEAGITECYEAVRRVMEALPAYAYEHLFIDNASQDHTVEILRGIASRDRRVKVIVNSRNFGAERSSYHAMLQGRGDAVIPVLADLQTPPDLIPAMLREWETGAEVVVALRRRTAERGPMRFARAAFYRIMQRLSNVEQIPNFMGFGLFDRRVMDALRGLNEPQPYFRGLIAEVGFTRRTLSYDQPARRHGRSSYRLLDLVDFALLALSSHSRAPLRLMMLGGMVVAALSFLTGIGYLIAKLLFWYSLPAGVAPILIALFFLSAVQIFALGLIGEYVGLLLSYARRFPLVVEKERINDDEASAGAIVKPR